MFLQPHHFQQQDRYFEKLIHTKTVRSPNDWGLHRLELDHSLLHLGKIGVSSCSGVLPDGTPFNIPDDDPLPAPIDIPVNAHDQTVFLALPLRRPGSVEFSDKTEVLARYEPRDIEIKDSVLGGDSVATVRVGSLCIRLLLEENDRSQYSCIGIARIGEVRPDKSVVLDTSYIPPLLNSQGDPNLSRLIRELHGMLRSRAESLSARLSSPAVTGIAELSDFLLLQTVNRWEPLFAHYARSLGLHPEDFYCTAIELAGDLSTFSTPQKRTPDMLAYDHSDLKSSFQSVSSTLRQLLSTEGVPRAITLNLQERPFGVRVAPIPDHSLIDEATFILAVKADIPVEQIRSGFPKHIKIGPVEQITQLVNLQLPGIGLTPLPVAPRQIPYHTGFSYFELDRTSEYWRSLSESGGIALQVPIKLFPGLELELWAIRSDR
jgi:type VI secretion system protein ImpJ